MLIGAEVAYDMEVQDRSRYVAADMKALMTHAVGDIGEALDASVSVELIMALANISPREREVLVGRFWDNKSLREIGLQMGVSTQRVKELQTRSLKKMRVAAAKLNGIPLKDLTVHGRMKLTGSESSHERTNN